MSQSRPALGVLLPADERRPDVRAQTEPFDAVAVAAQGLRTAAWWAVVDPGVTLLPGFAAQMRRHLAEAPAGAALSSDFLAAGRRVRVGGWSVERARWQDYTGPVAVVPREALTGLEPLGPPSPGSGAPADPSTADVAVTPAAGSTGPETGWNSSSAWRIAALRRAGAVHDVPEPLYRVRRDVIRDLSPEQRRQFLPVDLPYTVTGDARRPGRRLRGRPTVSIVIPTRGGSGEVRGRTCRLVDHCLEHVLPTLAHEALQVDVVLVADTDADRSYADAWAARLADRLTVIGTDPPFNFSHKINVGVAAARGEFVCLLNDDIEPITPDWLLEMVALASEPDVGAVGALLLYEDGTIQHAGHVMGGDGVHLVDLGRRPEDGPRRRNLSDRDVSGVSAACLVQRTEIWHRMGGLDPAFPVSFNDVDYTERIRAAGLRVVQCNAARLYHFESRTRVAGARPEEVRLLRSRWGAQMIGPDPLTSWEPADAPVVRFPVLRYRLGRIPAEYRAGGAKAVLAAAWTSARGRIHRQERDSDAVAPFSAGDHFNR